MLGVNPNDKMLGMNPIRDRLFQQQLCFPAPLETDSMLEEVGPPAMKNSNELGDDHDGGRNVASEDSDVGLAETEQRRVITDGFDVEIVPPELSGRFLTFEYNSNICSVDRYTRQNAYYCANFAVDFYSEHKKSKLYFVMLLKFNFDKFMEPNMYYLTFEAMDEPRGPKSVCQAKVAFSEFKGDRKAEVLLFRKKSSTYEQSKGVEQEHGTDSMLKENPFPPSDALWEEELVVSLALENPRGDDHDSERSKNEEGHDHDSKRSMVKGGDDHDSKRSKDKGGDNHDSKRSKDKGGDNHVSKRSKYERGDDTISRRLALERRQRGCRMFEQQWRNSEGFDVKVPPYGFMCGGGVLIVEDLASIKKLDKYPYHTAYYCAKSAVNYANEKHEKSKLEFVELVKFNLDYMKSFGGRPRVYYITLEARDGGDGRGSMYQAKVMYSEGGGQRNAKVVLFRKKGSKEKI